MKRTTLVFYVLTAALVSCGPNAEERGKQASLQAAREDSIRIVVQMETKLRMERKLILEDSLLQEQSLTEGMDNRLTYLQADLVAEKDKLEVIKQRQFLRTPEEREQQVKRQAIRIGELESEIMSLTREIEARRSHIHELEKALLKSSKP